MPLRLGLLGVGRWGRIYIRSIAAMPEFALTAVGSRNAETQALVPAGCRVSADWRDVVTARDVDAVIVATPPELHFPMAQAALDAGKPALVEKPFTYDLAQAEALAAQAQARGICLMVEHTHLFSPAFRALQAAQPALGSIRHVCGRGHGEGPFRDMPVLWDWAPHDISMALTLLGRPVAVHATSQETRPGVLNGQTVTLALRFNNGATADLLVSNILAPKRRWFQVDCEGGSLTYDNLAPDKLVQQIGGERTALPVADEQPLTVALREFAAAARGEPKPEDMALALDVMKVLAISQQQIGSHAP